MFYETINKSHIIFFDSFDCGDDGLNNYLKELALKDQDDRKCTTTLVFSRYRGNISLVGYFTLKNTCLIYKPDEKAKIGLPAVEIVFLAVNKKKQRRGIGSKILKKIIYDTVIYSNTFSAVFAIVLSSLNDAVEFYKNSRFIDTDEYFELMPDECRETTTSLFLNLYMEY